VSGAGAGPKHCRRGLARWTPLGSRLVPEARHAPLELQTSLSTAKGLRRGLYLHIPFCAVKCYFCDFTAFSGQNRWHDRYLDAIKAELSFYRRYPTQTLYIGGGTPTQLEISELRRLLDILRRAGRLENLAEATCEAYPASADADKLEALLRYGVNRLSIGLQTSAPERLKSLGRNHNFIRFRKTFVQARRLGFDNINVDLIYALPGQSLSDWRRTLRQIVSISPEHLSLYSLQIEERTVFAKKGVRIDPDLAARMYEWACGFLETEGYGQYELSNFALPGRESKHNLLYWTGGEYLGVGCGASSYLSGVRRTNQDRLDRYCESLERHEKPVLFEEKLCGKAKLGEYILLNLRTCRGVFWTTQMERAFADSRRTLQDLGLLERTGRQLRLTRRGMLLANRVFREFVRPFASDAARAFSNPRMSLKTVDGPL